MTAPAMYAREAADQVSALRYAVIEATSATPYGLMGRFMLDSTGAFLDGVWEALIALTPGTLIDGDLLDRCRHRYVVAMQIAKQSADEAAA